MRLYRDSIAAHLLDEIRYYGNLPYSALKLLPHNYESVKDAAQALIRAGYVGVIKAKHLKSLYTTAQGMKALELYCEHNCAEFYERAPVIYYAPKLYRVVRLTETRLLFDLAAPGSYSDSRRLKRELEETARASDKLKYSRFAGIWLTKSAGWVVYHFGRTNIQLNERGELNARLLAEEKLRGCACSAHTPVLILGDSTQTALAVLRYTQWFFAKKEGQRKHLKNVHYHLPIGSWLADNTYFLPIAQTSVQILQMISRGKWDETMQRVHDAYLGRGMEVCGLLDCKLKQLYCAHVYYDKNGAERLLVVCYEWQESMVNAYFADIADRVEIHVQVVPQKSIWDWYQGGEIELQYSPYRLSSEGTDDSSHA